MSNIFLPIIIFLGLIILISSFFIVKQQTAAIIERFGRFPHRNKILGRENTSAEQDYLNSDQAFLG